MAPAISESSDAILKALEGQLTGLHCGYKTLIGLFGVSIEQSELLQQVAGALFDTIDRTLLRDVILGVARLTDPLQTSGKDNLVLARLAELPEVKADGALFVAVSAKLKDVEGQAKPFRQHRHKVLAHLDLPKVIDPNSVVPDFPRQDVEAILAGMEELFNLVSVSVLARPVIFHDVTIYGGAPWLVRALEESAFWRELPREERTRLRRDFS